MERLYPPLLHGGAAMTMRARSRAAIASGGACLEQPLLLEKLRQYFESNFAVVDLEHALLDG